MANNLIPFLASADLPYGTQGITPEAGDSSSLLATTAFVTSATATLGSAYIAADASLSATLTANYQAADATVTANYKAADSTVTSAFQAADATLKASYQAADSTLQAHIDINNTLLASLANAFVYQGTVTGGTVGVPFDMATLTEKHAGDYYKVTTPGYFILAPATAVFANTNDGVVFNNAAGIDVIDNTNSTVAGTASRIAVSGSTDTGYTVDIDATYLAYVSAIDATLGQEILDREAADATLRADFAAADATLGSAYIAADASLSATLTANYGAADATIIANYGAADATLRADFAAADASLSATLTANYQAADATVTAAFGAADASLSATLTANYQAADATLRANYGAADATLRADFGAADATIIANYQAADATLQANIDGSRYHISFGNDVATEYNINHKLATTDVMVQLYETTGTFRQVMAEVQIVDANNVKLLFNNPVSSTAQLRVVVIKG